MAEQLKRRIGLGLLTAYGIGVMVGAGIYVLIGAVVDEAGVWSPLSFIAAGLIAAPTALSYAEFSSRLPEAAGEAAYIEAGTGRRWLGALVGLAIIAAGTVSAAAVLRGGVGYLGVVTGIGPVAGIVGLGAALILVACVGVLESLSFAALFTLIEVIGLGLVLWAGAQGDPVPDYALPHALSLGGIGAGAVLAFFAFIGFEDIVNMAEEVRNPSRTIPRAIILSLALTSVLYMVVCWAAVRAVPLEELAGSEQPLALVWEYGTGGSARFLSVIAVFAAANGILAQIVMASRVMFGLGKRNRLFALFRRTSARFGTPVLATCLVGAVVIAAALALPVATLAETTSVVLLSVFVLVNAALLMVKRTGSAAAFSVPVFVPVLGLIASAAALTLTLWNQVI